MLMTKRTVSDFIYLVVCILYLLLFFLYYVPLISHLKSCTAALMIFSQWGKQIDKQHCVTPFYSCMRKFVFFQAMRLSLTEFEIIIMRMRAQGGDRAPRRVYRKCELKSWKRDKQLVALFFEHCWYSSTLYAFGIASQAPTIYKISSG